MVTGVLCVVASITALAILEGRVVRAPGVRRRLLALARRPHRHRRSGALAPHRCDLVGRRLQPDHRPRLQRAGYSANYYRYFGAAEAPFDWYQSVLAHPRLGEYRRNLDAAAGTGRGHRQLVDPVHFILPRLGFGAGRPDHNSIAVVTGGAMFLAAWRRSTTDCAPSVDRLRRAAGLGTGGTHRGNPPVCTDRGSDRRGGVLRDAGASVDGAGTTSGGCA